MAKLTGPLLSLSAKGSIGDTLTLSKWKGIHTARKFAPPANPNTENQRLARSNFVTVLGLIRYCSAYEQCIPAWGRYAATLKTPMTAQNALMSVALKTIDGDWHGVWGASAADNASDKTEWDMIDPVDGPAGGGGPLDMYRGTTIANMALLDSGLMCTDGKLVSTTSQVAGVRYYVQLRKGQDPRSGIHVVQMAPI